MLVGVSLLSAIDHDFIATGLPMAPHVQWYTKYVPLSCTVQQLYYEG